jgi:hypothetical protein
MIADNSTADVLTELRSLVRLRAFLIALIEKERRPETEKAAAVANYEREIAALNAAIEVLAARHDCRGNRTIKQSSTGQCAPRPARARLRGVK